MGHWTLILIAAGANVALNLLLRAGGRALDTSSLRQLLISIVSSPWMWLAVLSAGVLLTAFVAAVREHSLSLTYTAVTALAMVALTAIGAALQHDQMSLMRVAGLMLIVAGLVLTAWRRDSPASCRTPTRRRLSVDLLAFALNAFCSPCCRHSTLGWRSPVAFGRKVA